MCFYNFYMRYFIFYRVQIFSLFATILACFIVPSSPLFSTNPPSISYQCTQIKFEYGGGSGDLPSLVPLERASLSLSCTDGPVLMSELFAGLETPLILSLEDFHRMGELATHYLRSLGLEGLVVFPDPNQIDPVSGRDLRLNGEGGIRFLIWVSRLQAVELEDGGVNQSIFTRLQSIAEKSVGDKSPHPLTSSDLRFWNRLGRAPSRSSQVVLSPGERPGQVVAVVKLRPKVNPQFSIMASNSGTPTTGEWILGASYTNEQLSGADDLLGLSYLSSDTGERRAYSVSYRRPVLFPDILELGIGLGYSNYDASSFAVTKIDFAGETRSADLSVRWNPLGTEFEKYSFSFEAGVRGERVQSSNSLIAGEADAGMVTPSVSVRLSTKGEYLRTESRLSLRGNVQSISTSNQSLLGGVNTKDRFERLSIDYLESFKLGKWLSDQFPDSFSESWSGQILLTRARADFALRDQRHLPQHQFIAGGTGSVRGYPESPIAGDSGYSISIEHRIPLPDSLLGEGNPLRTTLIPFVDWGETFVTDPLFYESDQSILGAGVGLEIKAPRGGSARIDFAAPLREIITNGTILEGTRSGDHRVHASVNWKF